MHRKFKKIGIILIIIISTSFWTHRKLQIKSVTNRVLNIPTEYRFIKDYTLSPSEKFCQKGPFIIVIVTSYVGNSEQRITLRNNLPQKQLESMNSTRLFLLAGIPPREKSITQSIIKEENENFHDILQGAFVESYRNLTIKHLMGLQWVATNCPNASYILKVDDDTIFRFKKIFNILKRNNTAKKDDVLMGFMLNDTQPKRDKTNKWYVSVKEYPKKKYPVYVSGWFYVTTPAVAAKLVNEAMYHPYFWVDDVLITGILIRALNISIIQLPEELWLEYNFMLHNHVKSMELLRYSLLQTPGPDLEYERETELYLHEYT